MGRLLAGAVLLALLAASANLRAAPVTMNFSGTLSPSAGNAEFLAEFFPGDTFSGSFTFESTTVDSASSLSFGLYRPAPAISITVNGHTFSMAAGSTDGYVRVINSAPFPLSTNGDELSVRNGVSASSGAALGPSFGGLSLSWIDMTLRDWEGTMFTSDALPATAPVIYGQVDYTFLTMGFYDATAGRYGFLQGPVTGMSMASPIPEPGTYAMLLAGLGLLGFSVRRVQRKAGVTA